MTRWVITKAAFARELKRVQRSALARNATWMLAGQGSGYVLQAAYFVILARLLGPREYGVYAGAFAFTGLVAQYCTLGTGTIFIRYVSGDSLEFRAYWGNILSVTFALSAVIIVGLCLLGPHVLNPASAALVLWAAISNCLCGQLIGETARVFQTFQKMRITALLSLLTNFARTLVAVGLFVLLRHCTALQWAFASTVVSGLAAIASIVLVTVYFGRPSVKLHIFLKHSLEGFEYTFASSTTSIYNDIDKTMLSHYGMNVANGIYTMAYRVIDIATMPVSALRDAALPMLFEQGRGGISAVTQLSKKLFKRTSLIALVMATALFVFAPVVPKVLGHKFDESSEALRWLCLIPVFRSVHMLAGWTVTCAGQQRYRTVSQVIVAVLNLSLNFWLIPAYGWRGAAWSSLMTDGMLGTLNIYILHMLTQRAERKDGAAKLAQAAASIAVK